MATGEELVRDVIECFDGQKLDTRKAPKSRSAPAEEKQPLSDFPRPREVGRLPHLSEPLTGHDGRPCYDRRDVAPLAELED